MNRFSQRSSRHPSNFMGWKPMPQFTSPGIQNAVVRMISSLVLGWIGFSCAACHLNKPPITSASASPSDVDFLRVPPTAKAVRFWSHFHDQIAVFEITEDEFRKMFIGIPFNEITAPVSYISNGFGNLKDFPSTYDASAEAGLFFERTQRNGGGERIIYDRTNQTAYYNYCAW